MTRSRPTKRQGAVALACAGGLLTAVGFAGLGPLSATASSHREAPLIAGTPQYDTTDVYAFRSPEKQSTVTLAANWLPFEEPAGGPNFYSFATDAQYDIHVDNNADAKPDVTFRWTFKDHYVSKDTFLAATGPVTSLKDKNLNYYQTYKLVRIEKGKTKTVVNSRRVAPSNVGAASMPDYAKLRNAGDDQGRQGRQVVRRPGRGLVLPRPACLRPALRRRPLRGRRRHPRRLQRPVGRPPGAPAAGSRRTATPRRTRSIGVWSTTAEEVDQRLASSRSPDWATRWSTRSSSR